MNSWSEIQSQTSQMMQSLLAGFFDIRMSNLYGKFYIREVLNYCKKEENNPQGKMQRNAIMTKIRTVGLDVVSPEKLFDVSILHHLLLYGFRSDFDVLFIGENLKTYREMVRRIALARDAISHDLSMSKDHLMTMKVLSDAILVSEALLDFLACSNEWSEDGKKKYVERIRREINNIRTLMTSSESLDHTETPQCASHGYSGVDTEAVVGINDSIPFSNCASSLDKRVPPTEPSFDSEINEMFNKLFGEPNDGRAVSSVEERMAAIRRKKYISSVERTFEKNKLSHEENKGQLSLVPREYVEKDDCAEMTGKHFTYPDILGFKTIIFGIYRNVDYRTLTAYYTCDPLESDRQESGNDDGGETTYYIDQPLGEDGMQIVLLHFNCENDEVVVNMGVVFDDHIKLSKRPEVLRIQRKYFYEPLHISPSLYNTSALTEDELAQIENKSSTMSEHWRETSVGEALTIIIDPDTALPVQRELYYDDDLNEWKAKIRVISNKSYFVFQIRKGGTPLSKEQLTFAEIARYYRNGIYGFPKDIIKAAIYFEKDGSPQSLYELAVLFRNNQSIYDEDTYMDYLNQATNAGSEQAKIELSIKLLYSSSRADKVQGKLLLQNMDRDNDLRNFLLGYYIEKGIIEEELEQAFNYYYAAANNDYPPAHVRLGETNLDFEKQREEFVRSRTLGELIADYCMGSVLFFGYGIIPQKEKGLELLEKSAKDGCLLSAQTLYHIFELDSEYCDDSKASFWFQIIEEKC